LAWDDLTPELEATSSIPRNSSISLRVIKKSAAEAFESAAC